MKRSRLVCIVVAAICLLASLQGVAAMSLKLEPLSPGQGVTTASVASASLASASANDNYPVSVDQAKNNIRVFMGDLSLEPVLTTTGSLPIGNYYYFTAGNSSFEVNQNSGAVEFAHFGDNTQNAGDIVLTSNQAYADATTYAGAKFADFSTRNWKLVVDRVDTQYEYYFNPSTGNWDYYTVIAYNFVFREQKDNVLLPSLVHVSVNAKTGSVIDYWGVDRLLTVSDLQGSVPLSDAVKTAENYFGGDFASTEGHREVIIQPQNFERLVWVVSLTGNHGDMYTAIVDANDGTFVGTHWDNDIWPVYWLRYYL